MVNVPILNPSGKPAGNYNTENFTYYKLINKHQMMMHPRYQGMQCVSVSMMKKLSEVGCKIFCFTYPIGFIIHYKLSVKCFRYRQTRINKNHTSKTIDICECL